MKTLPVLTLLAALALAALPAGAAENAKTAKAKPYPLKTCLVSGEEINDKGDMKPHTFVVDGQEVKLCCKSCLKDFNKDKAGYLKKIAEANQKQK